MNRALNPLAVVLLCTVAFAEGGGSQPTDPTPAAGGQASPTASNEGHESFRIADGSIFHVVLAKNVDAKKNKVGDEVTTTIVEDLRSNGQIVVPKNSVVVGHITQIQAHSKEHPQSQVAVAFDRLVIKDGAEIPLSASIQAIATAETAPTNDSEQSGTGYGEMGGTGAGSGGRGSPSGGGARGSVAGPAGAANSIGSIGDKSNGSRGLSAASQGVIGIKGLSLSTEGETSQDSVISSDHQNVHLEHGTQFVLRVKAKS